jgi:thiosulfate/3-mercaptopyruvate sulfurtransferase
MLSLGYMKAIAAICAVYMLIGSNAVQAADEANLMQPKELAALLAKPGADKLTLIHVGFPFLYRGKHIPHSIYAGPGAKPEGLELLKAAVAKLPRDREIIIYCGCCPWTECPNMRPAIALLRQMGFTKFRALMIPTNLAKDWTAKGYPVESGTPNP